MVRVKCSVACLLVVFAKIGQNSFYGFTNSGAGKTFFSDSVREVQDDVVRIDHHIVEIKSGMNISESLHITLSSTHIFSCSIHFFKPIRLFQHQIVQQFVVILHLLVRYKTTNHLSTTLHLTF